MMPPPEEIDSAHKLLGGISKKWRSRYRLHLRFSKLLGKPFDQRRLELRSEFVERSLDGHRIVDG